MPRILVLSGANLNLLGVREPEVYGATTLDAIHARLSQHASAQGFEVECAQSNHEGVLIDRMHAAMGTFVGMLINPGGWTHTSVVLRDAIKAVGIPTVEVHLSNVDAREPFRRRSLIAPVCLGRVSGFGAASYVLALDGLIEHLRSIEVRR